MEETRRILRRSVHAFLQDYQAFASTAALLVFPVAASVLLSQVLAPHSSPLLEAIRARLGALFVAAGFPASSELFAYLNLKFSQTLFSFALTFPFTLTFLVLAKAAAIQLACGRGRRLGGPAPPMSSLLRLYPPLLRTHLCNALVLLSANASVFALLFVAFNATGLLGLTSDEAALCLSAAGAVVYSVVLANALVACNMAVVISGVEGSGGLLPILKACLLVRGRAATALTLALPANLFMATAEALFQLRVVKPYRAAGRWSPSVVWEGATIAYIYSLIVVLDVVVSCMFFKSCKLQTCSSGWMLGSDRPSDIAGEKEEENAAVTSAVIRLKLQELP
ncbi:hypothetical protein Taro_023693 [Colocasia esculenta]|uniref:Transmembrane protein n=1 Tax=Colocasia esculenta TaxID=4460 RepID=A0A843VC74_COLES|nr:hypothetical protein [Colocasia esculenta]